MPPARTYDLWRLHSLSWANRARFWFLERRLRDRIRFGPGCDIWAGGFIFKGEGRAVFHAGCAVERGPFPFLLEIGEGGLVTFAESCWVRGKYRPNVVTCFDSARITIGPGSILNGVIISARSSITLGRECLLSFNTTILDSNLHPLSKAEELQVQPVTVGDHVLIAAGCMLLPGAEIGSHSVIGAGSVVTGPIPDHVLAVGAPARVVREISDRDGC